jgi:murein DD-endopeptidase MepM/ murein hydrolase activator NlpD
MGISSLYGHLASIDVKAGDTVTRGQIVGRSGMTGLAGGDHLHFSIQLQGRPVNPVEWWDPHWIEDRVLRKIREAGGQPAVAPVAAQETAGAADTAAPRKKAHPSRPARRAGRRAVRH